jgi:effector-binding domain-containing protein
MQQVRQNIYLTSLGKWVKYAKQLEPIRTLLLPHLRRMLAKGELPYASRMNWKLDTDFDYNVSFPKSGRDSNTEPIATKRDSAKTATAPVTAKTTSATKNSVLNQVREEKRREDESTIQPKGDRAQPTGKKGKKGKKGTAKTRAHVVDIDGGGSESGDNPTDETTGGGDKASTKKQPKASMKSRRKSPKSKSRRSKSNQPASASGDERQRKKSGEDNDGKETKRKQAKAKGKQSKGERGKKTPLNSRKGKQSKVSKKDPIKKKNPGNPPASLPSDRPASTPPSPEQPTSPMKKKLESLMERIYSSVDPQLRTFLPQIIKALPYRSEDAFINEMCALGIALFNLGKLPESIAFLEEVVKYKRHIFSGYVALGSALAMNGDLEDSLLVFSRLISGLKEVGLNISQDVYERRAQVHHTPSHQTTYIIYLIICFDYSKTSLAP